MVLLLFDKVCKETQIAIRQRAYVYVNVMLVIALFQIIYAKMVDLLLFSSVGAWME